MFNGSWVSPSNPLPFLIVIVRCNPPSQRHIEQCNTWQRTRLLSHWTRRIQQQRYWREDIVVHMLCVADTVALKTADPPTAAAAAGGADSWTTSRKYVISNPISCRRTTTNKHRLSDDRKTDVFPTTNNALNIVIVNLYWAILCPKLDHTILAKQFNNQNFQSHTNKEKCSDTFRLIQYWCLDSQSFQENLPQANSILYVRDCIRMFLIDSIEYEMDNGEKLLQLLYRIN